MKRILAVFFGVILTIQFSFSQDDINVITTGVPFLLISPEARGGAMGDVGVASSPDAQSMYWNPAKYAFIENPLGLQISYSPWLRDLVDDIGMSYISGYYKIDEISAIAGSLRYFSLGEVQFTDEFGNNTIQVKPNEFAIDATYSRKLTQYLSGAVAARFIHSDLKLGQGSQAGAEDSRPASTYAADVAVYYERPLDISGLEGAQLAWGVNISNIGAKISYTSSTEEDFIPTNLRFGPAFTMDLDNYNSLTFMFDINKLLVPTPPNYYPDSVDNQGNLVIEDGYDPDVSVVGGMIQSFYDAPGGMSEEIKEYTFSGGVEYWYNKQFAIRTGYFSENKFKGNRNFMTFGVGLKYNVFGLDFSYLVPFDQKSPLDNTLRFTLLFNFENLDQGGE